ncbi:MAG: IS630 family transposase, partial [Pseudanabaenaceae cyanobacterium bins.68]|nr:IS630 family transposase [Pseudanabaenaceae cyanobacterium bins.68]
MTEPYSLDFRQKVVEASKIFNISSNTIDLWLKRRDETGNLKPIPNKPPGSNHRIIDWQKFREFANRHGDKTEKQMAELWEGEISLRTISR